MITLYHYLLCPNSRLVRILLKELDINYNTEEIKYWLRPEKLINLNPAGELPVIVDSTNTTVCGIYPIIEYLLELVPEIHLNASTIHDRIEMRRLIDWVTRKFYNEVTRYILSEKLLKLIARTGSPKTEFLRAAKLNANYHFEYLINLVNARGNLATDKLTVADLALAAQISVLDYFGEINWVKLSGLKTWYAPIKSRPSFKAILKDKISMINPPIYYSNLDF